MPVLWFCCRLLGLPLHFRRLSHVELQPTIDQISARLPRWRRKLLSSMARLVLVNSVLSATPTYLLTVFKLGTWATKQIDKIR